MSVYDFGRGKLVNEFECAMLVNLNSLPASSVLELDTLIHNDAQHRCFIYWVCLPIPQAYRFSHSSPKIPCAFSSSLIVFYIPAFTENLKKNYSVVESCHIIMYYLCTFIMFKIEKKRNFSQNKNIDSFNIIKGIYHCLFYNSYF